MSLHTEQSWPAAQLIIDQRSRALISPYYTHCSAHLAVKDSSCRSHWVGLVLDHCSRPQVAAAMDGHVLAVEVADCSDNRFDPVAALHIVLEAEEDMCCTVRQMEEADNRARPYVVEDDRILE